MKGLPSMNSRGRVGCVRVLRVWIRRMMLSGIVMLLYLAASALASGQNEVGHCLRVAEIRT